MSKEFIKFMSRPIKKMHHNNMYYRCKTHTMSKQEYEELSREIYIANCYLTAKEKRELPEK